jgi:hypothetical protein
MTRISLIAANTFAFGLAVADFQIYTTSSGGFVSMPDILYTHTMSPS